MSDYETILYEVNGTQAKITLNRPDSLNGIFEMLKEAALTMQQGGGIGYDFSTIRPKGADVLGVSADASGPLSFMDVWDSMCRTIMSAGSRRGGWTRGRSLARVS